MFLVGMLSVSRLAVLRYPHRNLSPTLAYAVPSTCILVMLAVSLGLIASGTMFTGYTPEWLVCTPMRFSLVDTSRFLTRRDLVNGIVLFAIYNLIPGLSILPISVSFALSLLLLKRSGECYDVIMTS